MSERPDVNGPAGEKWVSAADRHEGDALSERPAPFIPCQRRPRLAAVEM